MKCESCSEMCQMKKELHISSPPSVLVIQLKRFDALSQSKIDTVLDFPLHNLNIKDFMGSDYEHNTTAGSPAAATAATGAEGSGNTSSYKVHTESKIEIEIEDGREFIDVDLYRDNSSHSSENMPNSNNFNGSNSFDTKEDNKRFISSFFL